MLGSGNQLSFNDKALLTLWIVTANVFHQPFSVVKIEKAFV